jgi:hypothetical protein
MACTVDIMRSQTAYTLVASELDYQPLGDRTHRGPRPGDQPDEDGRLRTCWGQLRSLYSREAFGAMPERGARPIRWVKAATICVRCGAFWPEHGLLEREVMATEQIA